MKVWGLSVKFRAVTLATALLGVTLSGCSQTSGDAKDFGPVDTSKAVKSEDVGNKPVPPPQGGSAPAPK